MAWKELTDKKSGRKYYYNKATKKTTWRKPADFATNQVKPKKKKTPAPVAHGTEFWERTDKKSGRKYFINAETRQTMWRLPAGAVIVEKPKKSKSSANLLKEASSRNAAATASAASAGAKQAVHVSKRGSVDVQEPKATVHVGTRGSISIEQRTSPRAAKPASVPLPAPSRVSPMRMGGVGSSRGVDADALKVWRTAVERYGNNPGLVALGDPVSVKTQVVSGTKYIFSFAGGKSASVWAQPWMDK